MAQPGRADLAAPGGKLKSRRGSMPLRGSAQQYACLVRQPPVRPLAEIRGPRHEVQGAAGGAEDGGETDRADAGQIRWRPAGEDRRITVMARPVVAIAAVRIG